MRIILVAALFVLLAIGSTARDNPSTVVDGRVWQEYGDSGPTGILIKGAYVRGAIEGLRVGALVGYLRGRIDEKNDALEYLKPCLDKGPCATIPVATLIRPEDGRTWTAIAAGADKVRAGYTPKGASVHDVVMQMDKFYSDYRNTPVCMIQALQEAVASLNGSPSTEKDLDVMRKGCNP